MRERPQFFKDLDRELGRGEPEPEPVKNDGTGSVEAIARRYENPQAADAVALEQAAYARAMVARYVSIRLPEMHLTSMVRSRW